MSFLPGMFPAGAIAAAAAAPASISYVGNVDSTANATSYSFAASAIGAAVAGRKVVVGAYIFGVAATMTATLAGNAMAQLGFADGSNASMGLFAIDEASLANATIVIGGFGGGTPTSCRIWIWNGFNCAATPHAVGSAISGAIIGPNAVWTSDPPMNCPAGSIVVAVSGYLDAVAAGLTTWTGGTERQDANLDGAARVCSSADTTLAAGDGAKVLSTANAIGGGPSGGGVLAVCL